MKIYRGTDSETAIKVAAKVGESHKIDYAVEQHLNELFGVANGAYFIINSREQSDFSGRKFRILYVEDKDEDRHSLFFQLIYS